MLMNVGAHIWSHQCLFGASGRSNCIISYLFIACFNSLGKTFNTIKEKQNSVLAAQPSR